ncbi:MAG: hypothetical protein QFX33_00465 [Candidatus Nezhaarchaeota archaeon]|nr:hypothetical protein [Candidatus Nezhaarchaeota archaeon]
MTVGIPPISSTRDEARSLALPLRMSEANIEKDSDRSRETATAIREDVMEPINGPSSP